MLLLSGADCLGIRKPAQHFASRECNQLRKRTSLSFVGEIPFIGVLYFKGRLLQRMLD